MLSPVTMTHLPVMMSSIAPSFPSYTCLLSFPWRLRSSVISSCCCRFPRCDGDWERRTDRVSTEWWRHHAATLRCISVRLETLQGSEVGIWPWCPPPAAPLAPFSQVTSAPGASFVRSPLLPADCKKTLIILLDAARRLDTVSSRRPQSGRSLRWQPERGRSLACLLTLYALMKRTKTGKKTEGGIVLELSPKNVTASSNAS